MKSKSSIGFNTPDKSVDHKYKDRLYKDRLYKLLGDLGVGDIEC